jgi:hypothetical protein
MVLKNFENEVNLHSLRMQVKFHGFSQPFFFASHDRPANTVFLLNHAHNEIKNKLIQLAVVTRRTDNDGVVIVDGRLFIELLLVALMKLKKYIFYNIINFIALC